MYNWRASQTSDYQSNKNHFTNSIDNNLSKIEIELQKGERTFGTQTYLLSWKKFISLQIKWFENDKVGRSPLWQNRTNLNQFKKGRAQDISYHKTNIINNSILISKVTWRTSVEWRQNQGYLISIKKNYQLV